jgi:hypothetical protein
VQFHFKVQGDKHLPLSIDLLPLGSDCALSCASALAATMLDVAAALPLCWDF